MQREQKGTRIHLHDWHKGGYRWPLGQTGSLSSCQERLTFWAVRRANLSLRSETVSRSDASGEGSICRNVEDVSGGLRVFTGGIFQSGWTVVRKYIFYPTRPSSWPPRLSRLSSTESRTVARRKLIRHQGCRLSRPALLSASLIYCTQMKWDIWSVSAAVKDKWQHKSAGIWRRVGLSTDLCFCSYWINGKLKQDKQQ